MIDQRRTLSRQPWCVIIEEQKVLYACNLEMVWNISQLWQLINSSMENVSKGVEGKRK